MKYGDDRAFKSRLIKGTYLHKIDSGKDRIVDLEYTAVFSLVAKKVSV